MKRLFAALLALCLLFSAALAEELNWEEYEEEVGRTGRTEQVKVPDKGTVKFWMPKTLKATDVKKIKADVRPAAAYKSKKGFAATITVMNVTSLEDYTNELKAAGADYFNNMKINGIDCVGCENEQSDMEMLLVPVDETTVLVYQLSPLDTEDEDWDEMKGYIIASIRFDK